MLQLDVEPPYGLRRQELIAKHVPPHVIDEGTARYQAWQPDREPALARARVPLIAVSTMTEWSAGDAAGLGWARHYIAGVSRRAMLRRLAVDLGVVTPRMIASVLIDRRTRDYIAYLETLRTRLQRNLEPV